MYLEIEEENMIQELFKKANELYGVDLSATEVVFANMGKTNAGEASREGTALKLRFNSQVPESVLNAEVIPHEIAHLVCFLRPELGKGHDAGWKGVCLSLGGVGTRTITGLDLKPSRVTKKFLYRTDSGKDAVLTSIRHNKLQKGKVFEYILNKQFSIKAEHFLQELE